MGQKKDYIDTGVLPGNGKYARFIQHLAEPYGGAQGILERIVPEGTLPDEFLADLLAYERQHLPAWMVEHQEEVMILGYAFGNVMGYAPRQLADIALAARFHDIGKCTVDAEIIQHKGKLDAEEYTKIKKHIRASCAVLKEKTRLSATALQIILYHHEYYDGSGYPEGLGADAIPLGARLICIMDSFSAMLGSRPYPNVNGRNLISAFQEIERGRGSLYDPLLSSRFIQFLHQSFIAWGQQKQRQEEEVRQAEVAAIVAHGYRRIMPAVSAG